MMMIISTYSEAEVVVGGGRLPPHCEEGVLYLEPYSGLKPILVLNLAWSLFWNLETKSGLKSG